MSRFFAGRALPALALVLLLAPLGAATPHAVVRLPSHGCSGTVIATGSNWSLILSCAHGWRGADAAKPIAVDAPAPTTGAPTKVGVRLLGIDHQADLSIILLSAGPLPYVAPVAEEGFRPGVCWSVGYDEMKLPPQQRPANIIAYQGAFTHTRERPWHGRSGGALLDQATGKLVGVTSAYSGPSNRVEIVPGCYGLYASHANILRFVAKHRPPGLIIERSFPDQNPLPLTPPAAPRPGGFAQPTPWGPQCPT